MGGVNGLSYSQMTESADRHNRPCLSSVRRGASMKGTSQRVEECPACGGRDFTKLAIPGHPIGPLIFSGSLSEFGLYRCRCGLAITRPRPSTQLLNYFYASDTYSCHKPNTSAEADRIASVQLKLIASHGPYSPAKRFLDFGCGGGFLLRHALRDGWSAMGFDVGKEAIKNCRDIQLPVTDTIADLPKHSFDVIVVNHVLEHIEELGTLLESMKSLLGPNGKLFIEVPNARSLRARLSFPTLSRHLGFDERYRAFPIHLWYFSPRSLSLLLRRYGIQPVSLTTRGMGLEELIFRSDSSVACTLAGNCETTSNSVVRGGSGLHSVREAIKKVFYGMNLGENLIAVARRA
jgi:SAM-dependent methyltransferase